MTTMAARIRNGSLVRLLLNSAAAPLKVVAMVSGRPICFSAFSIAGIASLNELPDLRLKEIVAAGNCSWCGMESAVLLTRIVANELNGTG